MHHNNSIKIIGLNTGRGAMCGENLKNEMIKKDIKIALVQEPLMIAHSDGQKHLAGEGDGVFAIYKKNCEETNPRAAIFYKGKPELAPRLIDELSSKDLATALWRVGGRPVILVSCYLHMEYDMLEALAGLNKIIEYSKGKNFLIHGDFNARSEFLTKDRITNHRGVLLEEWVEANCLSLHNTKKLATFLTFTKEGKTKSSIIDYTITDINFKNNIKNWKVDKNDSMSDHKMITFEIEYIQNNLNQERRLYDFKKANWPLFDEVMEANKMARPTNKCEIDVFAEYEMNVLLKACNAGIPVKKSKVFQNHWWNTKLDSLKKQVNKAKKKCAKLSLNESLDPAIFRVLYNAHQMLLRKYKKEIIKAKQKCFRKFCAEINSSNFWQKLKALQNRPQLPVTLNKRTGGLCETEEEMAEELLDAFFPEAEPHQHLKNNQPLHNETKQISVDENELNLTVEKLPNKKAPGLDGFTGIVFKRYFSKRSKTFMELVESCLNLGHFPSIWKTGKVIPVPKGNNETTYKFFRPITLLSIAGKCVEKVFIDIIINEIKNNGFWREEQFGFTKGKSTEDALNEVVDSLKARKQAKENSLILSLDITGAFDNIGHDKLIRLLNEYNVPANLVSIVISYLNDRTVILEMGESSATKTVTRGCAQGSKCGPGLFMIVMNDLLAKISTTEIKAVAYADDLLLIISSKSIQTIQAKTKAILKLIKAWGALSGLSFNPNKTQSMLIRSKLKTIWPQIKMEQKLLEEQKTVKYLGVYLQYNLKWTVHINEIKKKAQKAIGKCARVLKKNYGIPTQFRKRIYQCVVSPICTYSASIWKEALETLNNTKKINTVEQNSACKILRCQRTGNHDIVMYLSELTPLKTLVKERVEGYEKRKNSLESKKEMKKRAIIERKKQREENYYKLPEFFKELLGKHVIIKTEEWQKLESCHFLLRTGFFIQFKENKCPNCKEKVRPTPKHILIDCKHWENERIIYLRPTELDRIGNLHKILTDKESAINFYSFCKIVCNHNNVIIPTESL